MSDGEGEYVVESIKRARVARKPGRGKHLIWQFLVKWKDWDDPDDDTWESVESFDDGSEHFMETFWNRAKPLLKGRDVRNLSLFEVGEEFFPVGPPRKALRAQTSTADLASTSAVDNLNQQPSISASTKSTKRKRTTSVTKNVSAGPSTPPEDQPSKAKRAKKNQSAPIPPPAQTRRSTARNRPKSPEFVPGSEEDEEEIVPSRKSDRTPRTENGSTRRGRRSAEPDEAEPDNSVSLDVAIQRAYAVLPEEPVSSRPTRSTRSRITMMEDTNMEGSISVKTRSSGKAAVQHGSPSSSKPDTSRKRKTGLGRSSAASVTQNNSLLTFKKGGLQSVKRRTLRSQDTLQSDSSDIEIVEQTHNSEPSSDIPTQEVIPSSEEPLVELAGLDRAAEDELPDFEDDDNAPATEAVQEKAGSLFHQSLNLAKEALFPTRFTAASTSVTNAVTTAWKRSTIFGPLGLASESKPDSSAEPSSTLLLLNLDVSVSVPVKLANLSTSDSSGLDSMAVTLTKGPPGKLYDRERAHKVLDILRCAGPSAKLALSSDATDQQKSYFESFHRQLSQDQLFIAGFDVVLAFCSSDSALIAQRLNLPSSLVAQSGNVLVSRVAIEDYTAFANAALEVEHIRW